MSKNWLLRSETEKPSGGLSQIAARVLATSFAMYRKLLFTKLILSLGNEHHHDPSYRRTQQPVNEIIVFARGRPSTGDSR